MITLALLVAAAALEISNNFDFATKKADGWETTATSHINWPDNKSPPTVVNVDCYGKNEQFNFTVDGSSALHLSINFLGLPDKDGERDEITLLGDRLWLYIDGDRWEFAHIPIRSNVFSNVKYPPEPVDIVTGGWRGYAMVRKTERDPWQNLSRIQEHLIAARKIEWSYKSTNWKDVDHRIVENQLPAGWKTQRYSIDNKGLGNAIAWCSRQVASEAANVLPDNLKQFIGN